jgi:hypothetical protein
MGGAGDFESDTVRSISKLQPDSEISLVHVS